MNLIHTIDEQVYYYIIRLTSKNMTIIMTMISHLGSAITFIGLTIALIFILKNKRNIKFITLNLILAFVINKILKFIIARPRPPILGIIKENRI